MRPAAPEAQGPAIAAPSGPVADISDVDPLAPRYQEWAERAARYKTVETPKAETLPFGADRLHHEIDRARAKNDSESWEYLVNLYFQHYPSDLTRLRRIDAEDVRTLEAIADLATVACCNADAVSTGFLAAQ